MIVLPFHDSFDVIMAKENTFWESTEHIVINKFRNFFFLSILFEGRLLDVSVNHNKIIFSFSGKGLLLVLSVGG